jgi:hypothetical protein
MEGTPWEQGTVPRGSEDEGTAGTPQSYTAYYTWKYKAGTVAQQTSTRILTYQEVLDTPILAYSETNRVVEGTEE